MTQTSIAFGEALFFGMWYFTILCLTIAVWIMTFQLVRIVNTLSSIRQYISNLTIAKVSAGENHHEIVARDT